MYEYLKPVRWGETEPTKIAVPAAEGMETDAGCLLFFDEFGKVCLAVAPGGWLWASRVTRPTPGDPSTP